jgi:hypothetical protein
MNKIKIHVNDPMLGGKEQALFKEFIIDENGRIG